MVKSIIIVKPINLIEVTIEKYDKSKLTQTKSNTYMYTNIAHLESKLFW